MGRRSTDDSSSLRIGGGHNRNAAAARPDRARLSSDSDSPLAEAQDRIGNREVLAALSGRSGSPFLDILRDTAMLEISGVETGSSLTGIRGNSELSAIVKGVDASGSGAEGGSAAQGGERLPAPLQRRMEMALGLNLADVRVHVGAQARAVVEGADARAVTVGEDIYFGEGEYMPGTPEGDALIAHELTHVRQYRRGALRRPAAKKKKPGPDTDPIEQDANKVAQMLSPNASSKGSDDSEGDTSGTAATLIDAPLVTVDDAVALLITSESEEDPQTLLKDLAKVRDFLETLWLWERRERIFEGAGIGATHVEQLEMMCFSWFGLGSVKTAYMHALAGSRPRGLLTKAITEVTSCRELYRVVNGELGTDHSKILAAIQRVSSVERKIGGAFAGVALALMVGPLAIPLAEGASTTGMIFFATRPMTSLAISEFVLGLAVSIGEGGIDKSSINKDNILETTIALLPQFIEIVLLHRIESGATRTVRVGLQVVSSEPDTSTSGTSGSGKTYRVTSVDEPTEEITSSQSKTGAKSTSGSPPSGTPGLDVEEDVAGQLPQGFTRVRYPAGKVPSSVPPPEGYVEVTRWMSEKEAVLWIKGGGNRVPLDVGSGGRVYVTVRGDPRPGPAGPVRVDFAVPQGTLYKGGEDTWFQIFQQGREIIIYDVTVYSR